MDHYPAINTQEHGFPSTSRQDSSSSVSKVTPGAPGESAPQAPYAAFSSSSRHESGISTRSISPMGEKALRIDAEYARYTDASPPYSEKEYEGRSEQDQTSMRREDYAKEISRAMGRQLVVGLKLDDGKPKEAELN
ncbi:hypothetical protein EJ02DRAFT_1997 [Clathrospora elynae]|uniref:Uncharacterized protein n=1 Tax=Clathrospora elynae TaxID=706981 RepID=A0A6A5TAA1_9PLEO|nr:hypothetical protein EJ02DRAFT_1997 [Clathrospora elynae]